MKKQPKKDDFQTPVPVCEYMVSLMPGSYATRDYRILEPTAGVGQLVTAIKKRFPFEEITAPEDFFLLPKDSWFDCIVMNPPFSRKGTNLKNAPKIDKKIRLDFYFLTECMKLSNNIIALVPWFVPINSDIRLKQLLDFGLRSITALPRNVFPGTRIQTCILELERAYRGSTEFRVFDRIQGHNNNLFINQKEEVL